MTSLPAQTGAILPPANLEDNRMPSVYLRGNVYWCAYPTWDGKRKQESTHFRDKADAQLFALQRERMHARCKAGELSVAELERRVGSPMSALDLLDDFLETVKPGTWRRDAQTIVEAFLPTAPDVRVYGDMAIVGQALEFIRSKSLSASRQMDYARTLKRWGRFLWRRGLIQVNELDRLEPAGGAESKRVQHRAMTPIEAEVLCQAEHGLLWRFRMWTGLRGETVQRLTRADVEFRDEGAVVRVAGPAVKNAQGGLLPLAPSLAAPLRAEVRMWHSTMPLFPQVRREMVAKWLKREAHLEGVNLRSFRKTFTAFCRAAGLADSIVGTLRLDVGSGGEKLRRWTYSDFEQEMPVLRAAVVQMEDWYCGQLQKEQTA